MKMKKGCKVLSIFLIFMLTLSVAATGKIQAYAVENTDEDSVSEKETVDSYAHSYLITAFDELADDIRWQNTTEPNLPEYVTGMVEGKTANIPVTWEADHDYDAASPESGLYVFTAKVGEGYTIP